MKKILKWAGIFIGALLAVVVVAGMIMHQPRPEGKTGPAADALARKMQRAIGKAAWDSTAIVGWNFGGMHEYLWDRNRNLVRVRWKSNEVLLDATDISGKAYREGRMLEGAKAQKLIDKAWAFFCNDSFWLNAPAKAFDRGTSRRIVALDDGRQGLLITYSTGGVTPGDSYLWILDEEGLPQSWKMWVSIIPVGGIASSWEDWTSLATGARIATSHQTLFLNLKIEDLKGAGDIQSFGLEEDPFGALFL